MHLSECANGFESVSAVQRWIATQTRVQSSPSASDSVWLSLKLEHGESVLVIPHDGGLAPRTQGPDTEQAFLYGNLDQLAYSCTRDELYLQIVRPVALSRTPL